MAATAEPGASKSAVTEREEATTGSGNGGGRLRWSGGGGGGSRAAPGSSSKATGRGLGRGRGGGGGGGGGDFFGFGGGGGGCSRGGGGGGCGGGGRGRRKFVDVGHMAHCWQSHRRQWSSRCLSLHHGLQSMSSGVASALAGRTTSRRRAESNTSSRDDCGEVVALVSLSTTLSTILSRFGSDNGEGGGGEASTRHTRAPEGVAWPPPGWQNPHAWQSQFGQ